MSSLRQVAIAAVKFFFLLTVTVTAQEFRGTILGHVTDPTGSVLPSASITITNQDTQVKNDAVTNGDGNDTLKGSGFVLEAK